MNSKKSVLAAAVLLATSFLSGCGAEIVDNGYRGVETRFGKVQDSVGSLEPGLWFYNPLTSSIREIDTRTMVEEAKFATYTKDLQQANIAVKLNWRIAPETVHKLVQEVQIGGGNLTTTLVNPAMEGALKRVVGQYEAAELVERRGKATEELQTTLRHALASRMILVERVEIVNIDYSTAFEKSVEDKVVAVQRAVEAVNKTKQIQEEAKQAVISATAQAESMRIRANALASNPRLVEYEAVQKWDGKLPQYQLGGATPFISVPQK